MVAVGKTGATLNWGGLDKAVGGAAKRLADHQRLLKTVGETLVSSTVQRFQDGQDPEGKAWKASKRAEAESGQTLVDKAQLRNSITAATTADSVLVGSNKEYAAIHQKGGQAGRGLKVTIPARPYLGFSKEDHEEVQALLAEHLAKALTGGS